MVSGVKILPSGRIRQEVAVGWNAVVHVLGETITFSANVKRVEKDCAAFKVKGQFIDASVKGGRVESGHFSKWY